MVKIIKNKLFIKVVIGPNVVIGDGVSMTKTAVFDGGHIKDNSWLSSTIIGWHSTIGRWARLEGEIMKVNILNHRSDCIG